MVTRPHGFSHSQRQSTSVSIFHSPMLYANDVDDYSNENFDVMIDFVKSWLDSAKQQFPFCSFSICTTGIHDGDYRIYAEVAIKGNNHDEAAEWLTWKTE